MNLKELQTRVGAGESFDYLFFWGHTVSGKVTKTCFSQWYPSPFEVEGITYPTAEHWMMAKKAERFGDHAAKKAILASADPKAAKAAGRAVRGYDGAVWDAARFDVVVEGNRHKFDAHPELRAYLLSTGEAVLVEASPVDAIWGIGLAADHADVARPSAWRGLNLLGYALMVVRQALRATGGSAA